MGKMNARLLVMGPLLTVLIMTQNLFGGLYAVLAGVESREKAEKVAAEAAEILKAFPAAASRVVLRKNSGLWLVEVGPLGSNTGATTSPLLSELSKHYPGILLLREEIRSSGRKRGQKTTEESFLSAAKKGRSWEWVVLMVMTLAGYVAYRRRRERLRYLKREQEVLETRQKSLGMKLKGVERGRE